MYNDRAPQMFIMMSIIEKIVLIPSEDNWLVNDGAFQLSKKVLLEARCS